MEESKVHDLYIQALQKDMDYLKTKGIFTLRYTQ